MKKIVWALSAGIMILGSACSHSSKETSDSNSEESVNLEDTRVFDTVSACEGNDSVVVRAGGEGESEGFGRCSKCYCKEFEGRGQTCRNCGHAYKAHY